MNEQIRELLKEHHPNELARITGADDKVCKKIVHEIQLELACDPNQWFVEHCGDGQYALFGKDHSCEWIDENGDFRCFDTEAEALAYLNDFQSYVIYKESRHDSETHTGNNMSQKEVLDTVTHELFIVIERLHHVLNNFDSISMRHECTAQLEVVLSKLNYLIDITKE